MRWELDHLQWPIESGSQYIETIGVGGIESELEEREDEDVQHVESLACMDMWRVAIDWNGRVRCARRQDAWEAVHAERERKKEKSCDTWHVLIGCLDFYLLNNLDSIILMQIFFFIFFIPKFMIFFLYK